MIWPVQRRSPGSCTSIGKGLALVLALFFCGLAPIGVVANEGSSRDGSAEASAAERSPAAWRQWGGPTRDFQAPASGLADRWPADGPRRLWRRELGEAYSAILYEDGRLYTMASAGERESVLCLDAATGQTIWETFYPHPPYVWQRGYGTGPRSTPLLVGDRLFVVGSAGTLTAVSKAEGEILWSRELLGDELAGNSLSHGYSSSPIAWEGAVILPVGGEDAALVAFEQETGEVRWRAHGFRNSYSSPRLARLAGRLQLLVFMTEELVGLDPGSGELLWRYPHANQWGHNVSMPIVVDDTVFLSSPQAGAAGLEFSREGDEIRYEEIWSTRRVQLYHVSAVVDGEWVYGSTGVTSPSFMTGVNLKTGEIAWKRRGFAKANCVAADGKILILDEDGVLSLATASPEELVVHAETQLLENVAWTAPTLVGSTLYVRDRGQILAVDLGETPLSPAG